MPVLQKPDVSTNDGVTVVTFGQGYRTITEDVVATASATLLDAAAGESTLMVIDLPHTEFFGSSFIETLFRVWKRLNERGGRFVLSRVAPYCVEVLRITHLDSLWPVYDSPEAAVSAVRTPV